MNIGLIGVGYVGLVTAAGLASRGHRVVCMDTDGRKVDAVNDGKPFLYEAGLEPLLARGVQDGALRATTDVCEAVRRADAVFVCVGTPSSADGGIDLRAVRDAARAIGNALRGQSYRTVIVVKSTVVPGTTERVVGPLIWERAGTDSRTIGLAMNPEFLREGQAVRDFLRPDRIVIGGLDGASTRTVADVYADFDVPVLTTNLQTAEVIKYTSNALLALLISFSNEIAAICEATSDTDVQEVLNSLCLDRRLSPVVDGARVRPEILEYLKAGCGFGGSCLPKDVRALAHYGRSIGAEPRLLEAVLRINKTRPSVLVRLAEAELGSVEGRSVAVLGLAFKAGTDDLRESAAIPVVEQLTRRGARVRAYDPAALDAARRFWAHNPAVRICDSAVEACEGAHAVMLVTAWPEFGELDWTRVRAAMAGVVLVDGRRVLRGADMIRAGFRYRAIGRGAAS